MSEMNFGRPTEIVKDMSAGSAPSPSTNAILPGWQEAPGNLLTGERSCGCPLLRTATTTQTCTSMRMVRRVRMSRLLARSHRLWGVAIEGSPK